MMIIRRKPIGFGNLRKPQSLGMRLWRDSVQRMHNHTVQRVSPSDEPLAPLDDFAEADAEFAEVEGGGDFAAEGYQDSFDAAIRAAEAPTPGVDKPVRRTPNRAGRQSVQRAPAGSQQSRATPKAPTPAVQRTPAEPPAASSGIFRRQQLTEGDTMPRDLSAIMNMHRERAGVPAAPGENPPPVVMDAPPIPSFLADRAVKKAEAPRSVTRKPTSAGSTVTPVQRQPQDAPAAFDPDEPPRPRRRAQIVDITPPKKGLPFGLDPDSDTPGESPSSMSPIGQPVQREAIPSIQADTSTSDNDDFFAALERASQGLPYSDAESVAPASTGATDAGQTLLDIDMRSLQSQPPPPTPPSAPSASNSAGVVQRALDDDAAVYEDEPSAADAYQTALNAAIARAEAPTPQDHDDSPDNPSDDFDPDDGGGDDHGGNGGGGRGNGGLPRSPVNTPKAGTSKPGSVQASRAPQDQASPSAPVDTGERRPSPSARVQRDSTSTPEQNAATYPADTQSNAAYQDALDAAIARAEAPSTPDLPPRAVVPKANPSNPTVQREFKKSNDSQKSSPKNTIGNADTDNNADSEPSDQHEPSRSRLQGQASSRIQREVMDDQPEAAFTEDFGMQSDATSATAISTSDSTISAIQRDFDANNNDHNDHNDDKDATDDTSAGDSGGTDYQDALNAAIARAEAPSTPPADLSTPAPRQPATVIQRDFDGDTGGVDNALVGYAGDADYQDALNAAIARAEAPSTPDMAQPLSAASRNTARQPQNTTPPVQRAFNPAMNTEPDDAPEFTEFTATDPASAQAPSTPRTTTVQREFAAQESEPTNATPYYPMGYDSAESYQAAISAAIQRAEAPTPPETPARRSPNVARKAASHTVQRSPQRTTRREATFSPSPINRNERREGVFLTGDVMDEPPSLEDDARAVWTGQSDAVQRDYEGGEDYGDYGVGDEAAFDTGDMVRRAPSAELDDGDGDNGNSSVEAELLQMIGLPPETPIARASTPQVQRTPAAEVDSPETAPPLGVVQRSVPTMLDSGRATSEHGNNESLGDKLSPEKSEQIEKVAQAVYSRLRDRLKIERERLRGRRS